MMPGLLSLALVGYIVSITLSTISVVYSAKSARRAASVMFVLTWVAHLAAVVREGIEAGGMPLGNVSQYLLVFGWIVLTLHLLVWFRFRVYVAGMVIPPLAALASIGALETAPAGPVTSAMTSRPLFLVHTTVSTLGMAILGVTFAMSVLYLVQDRALKAKKTLALLDRLPSLEKCDQIGVRSLIVGFLLLTFGISTGLIVNTYVYHRVWVWSAKSTFPLLAWVVFAAILLARSALGFRGRKSAYLTITGFALGVLTVIGMTL
jgi:ABC-type uncharacterized transport system permease subunit